MLDYWQVHVSFVMKSLAHVQTQKTLSKAKAYLARLADVLLNRCQETQGYLTLAMLTDTFEFKKLLEKSKTNLLNVDLRINYLITLLTKL